MSDPAPYSVSYSFGGFQANNPSSPLPASPLDNEFANAAAASAAVVAALKDIRRSDGALKNGIVTFDSFAQGLQLTVDPTNGQLVAAAVAGAQASATSAAGSNASAGAHDTSAANSAAAAAASAATVNLALYLPKAGNLAGIGSADTARSNINAAARDASDMTGRLAPVSGVGVSDWNTVVKSGWYTGIGAANGPDGTNWWLGHVLALDAFYVTQIVYAINLANTGDTSSVLIFRRHGWNNGGLAAWTPWVSMSPAQVGSTIWVNATSAPPGYLKENGALLSRASFPALYAFAASSGNFTTEANWLAGNTGAFTSGDLVTTFRIPDSRGEFIRNFDDGRGIDSGRIIWSLQTDSLKDHTHSYQVCTFPNITAGGSFPAGGALTGATTGSPSTGAAAETRPRNLTKLACIKY